MKRLLLLFLLAPVLGLAQIILPGAPVVLSAISGASAPPSGAAGGVLGGTYPNPGFGSFTSATLRTALSDGSGTGVALFQNGALGTPISGTVTNLTGTASININGTVGAGTPAAGAFTTLSATGLSSFPGLKAQKTTATSGFLDVADEGANVYNVLYSRDNANSTYLPFLVRAGNIVMSPGTDVAVFSSTGLAVTGVLSTTGASTIGSAGTSIKNIRHGITTNLSGGTLVVSDAGATANTRYFFSTHALGTIILPAAYYASARSAGVSFTILSNQATDTSTVDWMAIEP